MNAVQAHADAPHVRLDDMKLAEEMRRALRDIRGVDKLESP